MYLFASVYLIGQAGNAEILLKSVREEYNNKKPIFGKTILNNHRKSGGNSSFENYFKILQTDNELIISHNSYNMNFVEMYLLSSICFSLAEDSSSYCSNVGGRFEQFEKVTHREAVSWFTGSVSPEMSFFKILFSILNVNGVSNSNNSHFSLLSDTIVDNIVYTRLILQDTAYHFDNIPPNVEVPFDMNEKDYRGKVSKKEVIWIEEETLDIVKLVLEWENSRLLMKSETIISKNEITEGNRMDFINCFSKN